MLPSLALNNVFKVNIKPAILKSQFEGTKLGEVPIPPEPPVGVHLFLGFRFTIKKDLNINIRYGQNTRVKNFQQKGRAASEKCQGITSQQSETQIKNQYNKYLWVL